MMRNDMFYRIRFAIMAHFVPGLDKLCTDLIRPFGKAFYRWIPPKIGVTLFSFDASN